jgi:hypothetical protein
VTRPIRPSELAAVATRAHQRLGDLLTDLPRLVAALRDYSAGIASGGGTPAPGHITDPTGHAAIATDEWAGARTRLEHAVRQIDQAAAVCDNIRRHTLEPPPPPLPVDRGLSVCANVHGCPDDNWAEPGHGGRCHACYEHRRRNDRDRRVSGASGTTRRSGEGSTTRASDGGIHNT